MQSVTKLVFAGLLGLGTVIPAGEAFSAPMSVPTPKIDRQSDVENVRWVRRCHMRRCNRVWVGQRHWRPRVVVRPRVVIRPAPRVVIRPAGNRHVQWCRANYRSYDRSTDTFVAYGGAVKRCMSPYR